MCGTIARRIRTEIPDKLSKDAREGRKQEKRREGVSAPTLYFAGWTFSFDRSSIFPRDSIRFGACWSENENLKALERRHCHKLPPLLIREANDT